MIFKKKSFKAIAVAAAVVTLASSLTIGAFAEETCEHQYDWQTVKAATCTDAGLAQQVCSLCGAKGDYQSIPATGHDFVYQTVKEATCSASGLAQQVCTVCGAKGDYQTIAQLDHNYELQTVKEATCTATGLAQQVCTVCGAKGDYQTVPQLDHTYELQTVKEPTCTATGLAQEVCTVCGAKGDYQTIDMVAHTPGDTVTENYVAPTTTEKGSKDLVVYCKVCNTELSRQTVEIPAKGSGRVPSTGDSYHTSVWTVVLISGFAALGYAIIPRKSVKGKF